MGNSTIEKERRGPEGIRTRGHLSRRTVIKGAAWSVPVVAAATAVPAHAASVPPLDPLTDLKVLGLGGAEGRYATRADYTSGVVSPNQDFRRAFSIQNIGAGSFTGSLTITFQFPRLWNAAVTNNSVDAFNNFGTVDLGGKNGASIGSASAWVTSTGNWVQNTGDSPYPNVWFRMDQASATLNNVNLPAGGTVWFALDAVVPQSWIGATGQYLPNGWKIYWRSDIYVTATTTAGAQLGTYGPVPDPDASSNWHNGIWYWNGGGPYAYDGGEGLYPAYGTA